MKPGKYEATVVQHELRQSQKGTWGLWVLFDVGESGPGQEQMGTTIWLSDKAMAMARKSIKAMGFDIDKHDLGQLDKARTALAGRKVEVEVGEETYKGETSIKIKFINRLREPITEDESKSLTHALREAKKTAGGVDEFDSASDDTAEGPPF